MIATIINVAGQVEMEKTINIFTTLFHYPEFLIDVFVSKIVPALKVRQSIAFLIIIVWIAPWNGEMLAKIALWIVSGWILLDSVILLMMFREFIRLKGI